MVAVTSREDIGADLVVAEATARGCDIYRFNSEDYPSPIGIVGGLPNRDSAMLLDPRDDVSLLSAGIWIRRPQWPTISRQLHDPLDIELAEQEAIAALGGLLRVLSSQCVSPPDALQASRWKLPQLSVAASLGLNVPKTIVTNSPARAQEFALHGASIVKAVADARVGSGADERVGGTTAASEIADWGETSYAPVLVQHMIPKIADVRVTAVGHRLFAIKILTPPSSAIDFRLADPGECEYALIDLPPHLTHQIQRFLEIFGLRFGAFDFALDDQDEYWFLECNPAGQWGWLEEATGAPITAALVDLLLSLRT